MDVNTLAEEGAKALLDTLAARLAKVEVEKHSPGYSTRFGLTHLLKGK